MTDHEIDDTEGQVFRPGVEKDAPEVDDTEGQISDPRVVKKTVEQETDDTEGHSIRGH